MSKTVSKKGEIERGQETLGEEESKWIVSTLGLVCFCNEVSYLVWLGVCLIQCVCVFELRFFFFFFKDCFQGAPFTCFPCDVFCTVFQPVWSVGRSVLGLAPDP